MTQSQHRIPVSSTFQVLPKPAIADVERWPLEGHFISTLRKEQGLGLQTAARGLLQPALSLAPLHANTPNSLLHCLCRLSRHSKSLTWLANPKKFTVWSFREVCWTLDLNPDEARKQCVYSTFKIVFIYIDIGQGFMCESKPSVSLHSKSYAMSNLLNCEWWFMSHGLKQPQRHVVTQHIRGETALMESWLHNTFPSCVNNAFFLKEKKTQKEMCSFSLESCPVSWTT